MWVRVSRFEGGSAEQFDEGMRYLEEHVLPAAGVETAGREGGRLRSPCSPLGLIRFTGHLNTETSISVEGSEPVREGGRFHAILLPGGVIPAGLAYTDLVRALGPEVDAHPKELELYAGSEPPTAWGLQTEIEGIRRFADEAGFERFHLVGYSGGGACALAFCATYPERLVSLALNEPAWTGNEGLSEDERELWAEFERIMALPPEQMMPEFVRIELEPGAELDPQPEGPTPPWMATRPAGLKAFMGAFKRSPLDIERLRAFY